MFPSCWSLLSWTELDLKIASAHNNSKSPYLKITSSHNNSRSDCLLVLRGAIMLHYLEITSTRSTFTPQSCVPSARRFWMRSDLNKIDLSTNNWRVCIRDDACHTNLNCQNNSWCIFIRLGLSSNNSLFLLINCMSYAFIVSIVIIWWLVNGDVRNSTQEMELQWLSTIDFLSFSLDPIINNIIIYITTMIILIKKDHPGKKWSSW